MKVLFLVPPVLDATRDVDRCFGCNYNIYFLPLLPVLYTATVLKELGEDVKIIDFAAERKTKTEFEDFIKNDSSDVYVFYTVFLSQNTDLSARDMIRKCRPDAAFIFLGPQPTWTAETFLDKDDTLVVRGEPEFVTRELIHALEAGRPLEGIRGVSYYCDGKMLHNPPSEFIMDIDEIPIPDRTLLDHRPYFNPKLRSTPHTAALTSRGCFGQCWFCVPNSLSYARELEYKKEHGRKPPPRLHSVRRVIEEFRQISALGFRSVSIVDDEFLWDELRTLDICEAIKDLRLEWSCLCRADMVSENVARALAGAGCAYVDLGTESFDVDVLADMRKEMHPEHTKNAVRWLKKYGVEVELNIIFGASPKETEATIKKTIREVKKLSVDYVLFNIANPFPGTDFYRAAKKEGWLFFGEYTPVDSMKDSIIFYPHLSKKKLESLLLYAYVTFYLDPRYLLRQFRKIRNWRDLSNKISAAFKFFAKYSTRKE